ncbi:hypothetical protein IFM89_027549 [Coptis chinensis]|uniref:Sec-independent protein translocase protein TATC, chloroplastic n=1 Tax=Coptis chinensis TaxID=261450 RepID=A0A835HKF0_9MAGN|nr:hypothetical protein IFM89_027549 [Coptis chinensis]
MMGCTSTSTALISHSPHINNSCFTSKQRTTSFVHFNSNTRRRRTNNKYQFFPNQLISYKRLGRIVCSAVEDLNGQKQQLGGVGSVLEEKPDPGDNLEDGAIENADQAEGSNSVYDFLYPSKELLPDDKEMSLFDHLEELRQRLFVSVLAVGAAMLGCFAFSKELIMILEAPVKSQGVKLSTTSSWRVFLYYCEGNSGQFLFVSGYCGLLLGSPIILYEIIAFVLPGLTSSERRFLGPIVLGSSVLFYAGIFFSYSVLTPAALNFFVTYAEGVVESLWSIDQYFEFVLVLMFSTGLSFQVPVIQLLLGQVGLVTGDQMLSIWRYVVVGAVVVAAVLTPSTDPLTQMLLAGPLLGLYLGGAWMAKLTGR